MINTITNGDCIELMKNIEIIKLYEVERWTLRMIAEKFDTDHHAIKRRLEKAGIKITRRNTLKAFTQEHRDKIGMALKGRKIWSQGKKMTKEHIIKNMMTHLQYDVTIEWLSQFYDIDKLKFLNRSISRTRDRNGFTTEIYKQFIEKFYYDEKFNHLFDKWILTKDKWIKPSLDHIKAKSKGGELLLDNLQFISWFENRAKVDIDQNEWKSMKDRINDYF